MHGNAWQWCADFYSKDYYARSPQDDPSGPGSGTLRVLRGGSWASRPDEARSARRGGVAPDFRRLTTGFRVARTL